MSGDTLGFIHRFVPATDETITSTLLLLHGTGGSEADLLQLGQTLAPGAALLSPRGQVLENGMPRFFRRLAEGVFDLEDLKQRTHELADFVEAASSHYGLDAGRMIAVGYSNGANIAASSLLLRPRVFSGAILLRSMLPLEPDTAPNLQDVPVLLASGRNDPLVPHASVERLAALLQQAGADVTLRWQEAGHGLAQEEIAAAQQWLERLTMNSE